MAYPNQAALNWIRMWGPPIHLGHERVSELGIEASAHAGADVTVPAADLRLLVAELQGWRSAARMLGHRLEPTSEPLERDVALAIEAASRNRRRARSSLVGAMNEVLARDPDLRWAAPWDFGGDLLEAAQRELAVCPLRAEIDPETLAVLIGEEVVLRVDLRATARDGHVVEAPRP